MTEGIEGTAEHDPRFFNLQLDVVLQKDCWNLCKVVTRQLKQSGYASVPMFFQNLPQCELDIILDKAFFIKSMEANANEPEVVRRRADLALLGMLLASSEGQCQFSAEDVTVLIGKLILFGTLTDMHRKGLIDAIFTKFTMTDTLPDFKSLFTSKVGEGT